MGFFCTLNHSNLCVSNLLCLLTKAVDLLETTQESITRVFVTDSYTFEIATMKLSKMMVNSCDLETNKC